MLPCLNILLHSDDIQESSQSGYRGYPCGRWHDVGVDVVTVRKLKRPIGSGVWGAYSLGTDRFGAWLHTPTGSLYRGEDGHRAGVCVVAQGNNGAGQPIVQLIAPGAWWIATWYPTGAAHDVTVDICTPAQFTERTWTYADLELDPWRSADGAVSTDDWDEFHAACAAGRISPTEASEAKTATTAIEARLKQRDEPFGHAGATKLTAALALELPPLPGGAVG
jgi:hypothetical protein